MKQQELERLAEFRSVVSRLSLLFRMERRVLGLIVSYAFAIALFSLIIPLTVQELVNTFAFAIQPVMIVTLAAIMVSTLLFVGAFRALQFYAVEILERRMFARTALAMSQHLPRFREESFLPQYTNYFMEAELMQRALSMLVMDVVNVVVGGAVGMTILVFYHPYFFFFNAALVTGFGVVVAALGHGGFRTTLSMSNAKYDTLNWLQEISNNLLPFKATVSRPLLLRRTDELVGTYTAARRARFNILLRQYLGGVGFQALGHSGIIGMAGWLLAVGQLTLGQFVAAEVIVGTMLLNFDGVIKRIGHFFYFLTALAKLDFFFSLPTDRTADRITVPLPDPTLHGIRVTCKGVAGGYADALPEFVGLDLEVSPGEKVAVFCGTDTAKSALGRVLAGLQAPTVGVVRYNGVDLRDLDLDTVNACRGVILDTHYTPLFEGTLEENITMGRPSIQYSDILWALRFVELEEEVDAMPLGLRTPIRARGRMLPGSQVLRIVVARAIVTRPYLLVLDTTLHSMPHEARETLLRRLCSKDEPWSAIFVSNDPSLSVHVERRISLC